MQAVIENTTTYDLSRFDRTAAKKEEKTAVKTKAKTRAKTSISFTS